jgi:hypothetical protein
LVEELDLNGEDQEDKPATEQKINEPDAEDESGSKPSGKEKKVPEPKWDLSLLDSLINNFVATNEEDMLPVLCGYFNRIIGSLLTKEKQKTLEYLFLKRNGAIFDALMKHINNHSLALLLIELLQI